MPSTPVRETGTTRPAHLAFIGTGGWSRRYHLPSLQYIRRHQLAKAYGRELILHGIFGLRADEAADLAKQYGFARVYGTLDELIADHDVDMVAIAITPTATKEVVLKVLGKNVPVFTEKPPGVTYAEAQELGRLVQVPNVVGFNRRYGLLNNRFKEHLGQTPRLGKVRGLMYRKNRREPDFIRATAPHLINLLEYFFGPIRALRNERGVEPATGGPVYRAHVRFESGLPGEILLSPCGDRHWEGIEVHPEIASDRTLILHSPHNDAPGEIMSRRPGAGPVEEIEPVEEVVIDRSGQHIPLLEEGYVWEYMDLLSTIDGASARSTFQNAVNTMRIAEAIDAGRDLV